MTVPQNVLESREGGDIGEHQSSLRRVISIGRACCFNRAEDADRRRVLIIVLTTGYVCMYVCSADACNLEHATVT